jgi:hypothetical protein
MKKFIVLIDISRYLTGDFTIDADSVDSEEFKIQFHRGLMGFREDVGEEVGPWLDELQGSEFEKEAKRCFSIYEVGEKLTPPGLLRFAKQRMDEEQAQWQQHMREQSEHNERERYEQLKQKFEK